MKLLTARFIIPITIISFVFVTKWWYVLPTDSQQTYYWGFPFAFVGESWQTSGALQFFLFEGLADFFIYFIFWFVLIFICHHFMALPIRNNILNLTIWPISLAILIAGGIFVFNSYPTIYLKRNYDWQLINSGYKFIWQNTPSPIDDDIRSNK